MTTTTATRTRDNSTSLWIKRAIAGSLLSLGPALVACGVAPDSFADTTDGNKGGPTTVSHSTAHGPAVHHIPNGAVKHHHRHHNKGGESGDGGGDE